MVFPVDEEDLLCMLDCVKREGIPLVILGGGTNVLFKDEGFDGIVAGLSRFSSKVKRDGDTIWVDGGTALSKALSTCAEWGLGGLEFAAGIPGLIGGAVIGNVGAFGGDISGVISSVRGVTLKTARTRTVGVPEIQFSYRKAILPEEMIITGVRLSLDPASHGDIMQRIRENRAHRKKSQPTGRTAGSVFKNPPGESAGKLIEECNLKGQRRGKALISEIHANFIVNTGGATYDDVIALVELMRRKVNHHFGVELELEWKLY